MTGRLTIVLTVMVLAPVSHASAGQSALPLPRLELGADVTAGTVQDNGGALVIAPRMTINLSPMWSVDVTGDRRTRRGPFAVYTEQNVIVQVRSRLWDRGALNAFVLAGAGTSEGRYEFHAATSVPSRYRTSLFLAGAGVSARITRHASLNVEVKVLPIKSLGFGARATAGVTVPIGRFPSSSDNGPLPLATLRGLRIGERVWVTTSDGDRLAGAIASWSPTMLVIAANREERAVPLDRIRRIEALETPRSRTRRGALAGGLIGGAAGVLRTLAWTRSNGGEGGAAIVIWAPGFGAIGAAAGALAGAGLDRRAATRRVVFERVTK